MRPAAASFLAGALTAGVTLAGGALALPLHDRIGGWVGPRELPVVLLSVGDSVADARAAALDAGAREVWIALPEGDARLGGARPDPGTLHPGTTGGSASTGTAACRCPRAWTGSSASTPISSAPALRPRASRAGRR